MRPRDRRREGAKAYYGQSEREAERECPYQLPYHRADWMQGWHNARIADEVRQDTPPTRDELFMELLDLVEDVIQHVDPGAVERLLEKHNELTIKAQEVMT